MVWYDPRRGRYRTSVTHKAFYGVGWPVLRFIAFRCMSSEQAHHLGMEMIRIISAIDLFVTGWRRVHLQGDHQ